MAVQKQAMPSFASIISVLSIVFYCAGFLRVELELHEHKKRINALESVAEVKPPSNDPEIIKNAPVQSNKVHRHMRQVDLTENATEAKSTEETMLKINKLLSGMGVHLCQSKGVTCSSGPPGPPGPPGPRGNRGVRGRRGQQGRTGNKGDKGIMRLPGKSGKQGPAGIAGTKGVKGDTGAAGMPGSKGDKGAAGMPGSKGHTGAAGMLGSKGQKGAAGMPGTKEEPDCSDLLKSGHTQSGLYSVDPDGRGNFTVNCDMRTDGGGWTVFQRRQDGSVDFYRGWNDYKAGFGQLTAEFWLGNDKIHRLTAFRPSTLRVELEDWNGIKVYAKYGRFNIGDEQAQYRLEVGLYSGTAGDSITGSQNLNHMAFTTKDRDND